MVTLYVEVVGEGKLTYQDQTDRQIAINLPMSEAGITSLATQPYLVKISETSGDISIKFSTISSSDSKQRAYLDEIKVVDDTNTAITTLSAEKKDAQIYDILGRKVNATGKGLYIIDGKKIVK